MIAASLPSQAELISSDYLSEGDSLAALDTETGLEWLSLSETNGMSINDALDAINGGKLDGWRLPTQDEVTTLLDSVFEDISFSDETTLYTTSYSSSSASYDDTNHWLTHIGEAYTTSERSWSYAFVDGEAVTLTGVFIQNGTVSIFRNFTHNDYSVDYSNNGQGIFLVSDGGLTYSSRNGVADVPLPLAPMALGLIFLPWARARMAQKK